MNYLNKISVFRSYRDTTPALEVSVLDFCKNVTGNVRGSYKDEITKLREIEDKKQRDQIKATLPAVTISGLFTERNNKGLFQHSGFICLDLDAKGNENISDWAALRDSLAGMEEVFFSALSASGKGVFLIVPVSSEKHREHFKALERDFSGIGLTVDRATKDPARLRGISFDPEAVINPDAKTYTRVYTPPKPKPHKHTTTGIKSLQSVRKWLDRNYSFTPGSRHEYITQYAAAANRFGIPESDTRQELISYQQSDFTGKEIENIIDSIYSHKEYFNTV